ncbi:hypothetical protein ACVOMS_01285 [Bradyrhizobium guangxiense]
MRVLIIFKVLNMTGSAFFEVSTSAQARREQLSTRLTMKAVLCGGVRNMSRDSWCRSTWPSLADLVLDNATLLLAHGRGSAVELIAFEDPVDGRGRGYCISPLAQGGMDLVSVHPSLPAGDDLRLDPFRLAPLTPFRPTALRQKSASAPLCR